MPEEARATGLMHSDQQVQLNELIGSIYDCAMDPARWAQVIRDMCVFTDSAAGTVAIVDLLNGRESTIANHGISPAYDRLYKERYHCTDLFIHPLLVREVGEPVTSSELVSDDVLLSSKIYREWASPQGFRDTLMTMFTRERAHLSFMGLTRTLEQRRYDDSDRRVMRMVCPHIQRSLTLSKLIEHRTVQHGHLLEVIDAFSTATFVVNGQSRLLHANASARAMLCKGVLARTDGGELQIEGVSLAALMVEQRGLGDRVPVTRTVSARGRQPGALLAMMPMASAARAPTGTESHHIVFLQDPSQVLPIASDVWTRLYALTGGELRVLQGLIEGLTPAEISDRYGVARSTVKTQVLSLFRKTGTNRQAELVRVALAAIPPVHTEAPD